MTTTVEAQDPTPDAAETDPPSGSGPGIVVRRSHGVVVVRPTCGLDRTMADRLSRMVIELEDPLIVDLDGCVLVDPASLETVAAVGTRSPGMELTIVCRRTSCRQLLTRVGIAERFAVFERVEDALQARVFALAGYGSGWSPAAVASVPHSSASLPSVPRPAPRDAV